MKFEAISESFSYLMTGPDFPGGLVFTLILAGISLILSLPLGILIGICRSTHIKVLRWPSLLYIELIRATPLLLLLFWSNFLVPMVLGMSSQTAVICITGFVVFTAAYIAEIVRSGIEAIPHGQVEAARGSGMTATQTMWKVVCPQALRNMIPSIVNQSVSLTKDTSLAGMFGVLELFRCAKQVSDRSLDPRVALPIYGFTLVVYFVVCYSLSTLGRWLEGNPSSR